MKTSVKTGFDIGWSLFILGIVVASIVPFVLLYTSDVVSNQTFFVIYGLLGILTFAGVGLALLFNGVARLRQKSIAVEAAPGLYVSDSSRLRLLAHPGLRLITLLLLVTFTIASVFGIGSYLGTPNPYSGESLVKSVLDQHPLLLNVLLVAHFPGLFEEFVIFLFVSVMVFLTMKSAGFSRKELETNLIVFLVAVVFWSAVGAALFSFAHIKVYGLNEQQLFAAFLFEFIMQFSNQLTGFFASWIPHFIHNALVVFQTQAVFAIGGILSILPIAHIPLAPVRDRLARDWAIARGAI